MAINIFISYAREDYQRVIDYYRFLKKAEFNVWMDKEDLRAGDPWGARIKESLQAADIVIFFLSKNTERIDQYFQKEKLFFHDLKKAGKKQYAIPALLDNCVLPVELEEYHGIDLNEESGWDKLTADILSYLSNMSTRKKTLTIGRSTFPLPCFFPSISSVAKSTLSVEDHLRFLIKINQPNFLISAYDIYELSINGEKKELIELINQAEEKGSVVLLDSGNYEEYWLHKKLKQNGMKLTNDSWSEEKLKKVLNRARFHIAFSYDKLEPSDDPKEVIPEIELSWMRIRKKALAMTTIAPIVHSQKAEDLPLICKEVADRIQPFLVAIPERELGDGIYERAKTIYEIRKALTTIGYYVPIHILGTGNPISLTVFSACGADSFDGLEWCQTVIDHESWRLYHSSLADLFLHQTPIGSIDIGFAAKIISHNLFFYKNLMPKIQKSIDNNTISDLLESYLPEHAITKLKQLIPEVF